MNIPYVKNYENGILTNPIPREGLKTQFPNRAKRRSLSKSKPFVGNSKNFHLTVIGTDKFKRIVQIVWDRAERKFKKIEHYIAQ